MHYKEVLKKIKAKVTSDFFLAPNPKLLFHNLDHIKKVVPRSRKIGSYYKLEHELLVTLLAAAWFQDIGYPYGKSKGHEKRSAEIAGAYLARDGADSQLIEAIKKTIITTQRFYGKSALWHNTDLRIKFGTSYNRHCLSPLPCSGRLTMEGFGRQMRSPCSGITTTAAVFISLP